MSTHGVVPIAGSILADWGAAVIKVEDPVHGDVMRGGTVWGVPTPEGGSGHLYHAFNRGKRGAAINLKHERGREALLRLAEQSDVFLTSFLSGVRQRLGIDVDDIRARRPDIIYGRNTELSPKVMGNINRQMEVSKAMSDRPVEDELGQNLSPKLGNR